MPSRRHYIPAGLQLIDFALKSSLNLHRRDKFSGETRILSVKRKSPSKTGLTIGHKLGNRGTKESSLDLIKCRC